jgi:hypothetical protein
LATLHIPSTVCKMGDSVFYDCTGLISITIPDALETIEARMFCNCNSLTHIEIPPKVTRIGDGAFQGCEGLKHLRIPSSVVEIGDSAFESCKQLTSVHLLGNSLHTIEKRTFYECSSLTHARIPSSVTRIESGAFGMCIRLISLELPEGLEMINPDEPEENSSLFCCRSLLHFVIPSKQDFERPFDVRLFMYHLRITHLVCHFKDPVSILQHRFDDLPVHRLCYYQSYYPLMEAMEKLRQSMDVDPAAGNKVDAFGMTPFHILALSQTPNLSLFQALMTTYNVDIVHTKETFGGWTPIDYLCMNHIPDSATVIQSLLQTIFAERARWLGLALWKTGMLASIDDALATEFSSRMSAVRMLCFKLATYERLESVSLLELALWKVKIDSRKTEYDTGRQLDKTSTRPKRPRLDKSNLYCVDRQSCLINSGADVVISNVLPFLAKVLRDDYYNDD